RGRRRRPRRRAGPEAGGGVRPNRPPLEKGGSMSRLFCFKMLLSPFRQHADKAVKLSLTALTRN
ncbi:hypothetical protein ABTN38_19900, partial [Acinetobacter baumannii]